MTAWESGAAAAHELLEMFTSEWQDRPAARFSWAPVADLRGGVDDQVDAVVIVACGGAPQREVLPLLARLDEATAAVLAVLDEPPGPKDPFTFAGAIAVTREGAPERLCSLLRGMLHRQPEIASLRSELSLSQRYHGGLEGEMARMHEEMQLAAMVQREFLPREIPSLCGVGAAVLWHPANYVSGDLYDIVRLDEDHLGVFLADAVGHGVPAALMTMVICRSLQTKVTEGSSYRLIEPAEVLRRLNDEMVDRPTRANRFATAVYAVVNCRERIMRVAGAGHPPPLLFGAGREPVALETTGGLLGVFEGESYDQVEIELETGDHVLFYSDGFEQAFPEANADPYQRRLPTHRYLDEFARLATLHSADEVIARMASRVSKQCGSLHQADDLTLIALHAGPLAQPDGMHEPASVEQVVTRRL